MRRRPTSRQLAVASSLLDADRGAKSEQLLMRDEDLVQVSEYSIRSILKAWDELIREDAVSVERSRRGVRIVTPHWEHPIFAMVELLEGVQP